MRNEVTANAENVFKSLKIRPPKQVIHLEETA
jgi:hypothetical protein